MINNKFDEYILLYKQGIAIYQVICSEVLKSNTKHGQEFYLLLLGILDSMDTLGLLAKHKKARDCYVISMTIYESIVNVMHILATNFKAMDDMTDYTFRKTQFEAVRSTATDREAVSMIFDGENHVIMFSDNNTINMGGDPRDWTKDNISKRHNAIDKKFGKHATRPLQLAHLVIYRVSSDIAHGTLYGMKHTMGLTYGKNFKDLDEQDMINHNLSTLTTLLLVASQALYPLISILERELKLVNYDQSFRNHLETMLLVGNKIIVPQDMHKYDFKKHQKWNLYLKRESLVLIFI